MEKVKCNSKLFKLLVSFIKKKTFFVVFSRYWKSISDLSNSHGSGTPSKSFLSQKSYSEAMNSDEMVSVIEMLMKAVSSCSKGKQEMKEIFDFLVTLTGFCCMKRRKQFIFEYLKAENKFYFFILENYLRIIFFYVLAVNIFLQCKIQYCTATI